MRSCLLLYLLLTTAIAAQATGADTAYRPVYYEPAPEGKVRFFYDDNYYLADKSCPFKAFERVATFDFSKQEFEGDFVDFNTAGRAILRGQYVDGKKEGTFTAYHPNGQVKWTVTFTDDAPSGLWLLYYPDGKPLLEVEYGNEGTIIRNFWDARGRQRVTDGNGRYDFEIRAEGYNPYGYIRYRRRGRVVNGRPDGNWIIEYIFEDGKKESAGHENYRDGRFVRGYEAFTDEMFADAPRYRLLPTWVFGRAEAMVSKACTIDEYSGFTQYLEKYVEQWLAPVPPESVPRQRVEFEVSVDETGIPLEIEAVQTLPDERQADLLLNAFRSIEFWFPSFADGDYIDDKLTVTAEVLPDPADQQIHFFNLQISREKGN